MDDQVLMVGLGNPGTPYASTRHNAGFLVIDEVARRLNLEFRTAGNMYLEATGSSDDRNLTLMKPQTYMNHSGSAVAAWALANGYPIPEAEVDDQTEGAISLSFRLLVLCDDLNLPLGALRMRGKGSSGGQNGLADIMKVLGTTEFPRLRLGIAPLEGPPDPAQWADYVLTPFQLSDFPTVKEMVERAAAACLDWLDFGTAHAASHHNWRPKLPGDTD